MNAEDRAYAARIGREVEQAILTLGPSHELLVTVQTTRHGHLRPAHKEIRITGPLTDEGPEEHTTP